MPTLSPITVITVILVIAATFTNGCSDAPNTVASAVATKALSTKNALRISAAFNFVGAFSMSVFAPFVTQTIYRMVDFDSQSSVYIALTACTVSVSAFALAAMRYGIPTSESHGMIAALAGAGIVTQNSLKVINGVSVLKAVLGLVLSVILAVILGYIITLIIKKATANVKISDKLLDGAQTFSLCVSSFLHGAQDGQKFLAVLLLSAAGSGCAYKTITALIIATALSIGTRFGGKKILTAIGFSLAPLDKRQGLSADITSSLTLTLCSIFGIPSSTTQTVSSAIVGSALYSDYKTINFGIVKNLMFAWLVTFPFCFLLSAFVASIIKLLI